jgi:hypothetical protein
MKNKKSLGKVRFVDTIKQIDYRLSGDLLVLQSTDGLNCHHRRLYQAIYHMGIFYIKKINSRPE